MINLLVYNDGATKLECTSFGGHPVKNHDQPFEWPICRTCTKPMQFLGKIATDRGIAQIFMCQNDPGLCDDFEPDGGGNTVIVTKPVNLVVVEPPIEGVTVRECEYGAKIIQYNATDYEAASTKWPGENDQNGRQVLGQLYGIPAWLQNDETPACHQCGQQMRLVAQLEEGPDWKTAMNFGGGGSAYLFDCACDGAATFLWQS